ncbi:OmpA family protein [Flammeovirga kamogawensis]|uniref:OmpA family protein n=1 Tax=Flammeovirga kamogawensis TaxID=373891 RepID=A0ABX8H2Q5_9BACT|nr:OmpA family protein [Flammeovirga kamogawensis]MBB6460392.1 outer membrane protein OmpA-like peptidoglycan-associated protein/tetratricopeptide (TPR) repeat protein [Flammeovirga kamogawensis]QWG10198.1 OmpA family protein [Flammeovirga kamogawensis]TRX64650.1 OmpA family protein [Flammeovirga kamogawensis]
MRLLICLLILCSLISTKSIAQSEKLKIADMFYNLHQYKKAIDRYKIVLRNKKEDPYVLNKIADSYRQINRVKESTKYYGRLAELEGQKAIYKFYYAQGLAEIGDYKEAKRWYETYFNEIGHPYQAERYMIYDSIDIFYKDSSRYIIDEIPFNTKFSEFGPVIKDSTIAFVSNRPPENKNFLTKKYNNDGSYFFNIYTTVDDINVRVENLDDDLNTKYHDGPIAYFHHEEAVLITRNYGGLAKKTVGEDKLNKLKILKITKNRKGEWKNEEVLPFNSKNYAVGHPTISADDQTIIFASNMPGGFGGTDLYKVTYKNGVWSNPINLGGNINTDGSELYPFLDKEGNLFFASNGHVGLGGLDIFVAEKVDRSFKKSYNIGYPVNTKHDDFSLTLDSTLVHGYFASRDRKIGKGDDDIYELTILPKKEYITLSGYVINAITKDTIPDAILQLKDTDENVLAETRSEETGLYYFDIEKNNDFILTGTKAFYNQKDSLFTTKKLAADVKTLKIDVLLKQPVLETVYFGFDQSIITMESVEILNNMIEILKKNPSVQIELSSHADSRGSDSYNEVLAKKRGTEVENFLIKKGIDKSRIVSNSYGEKQSVNDCGDDKDCTEALYQLNRRTEILIK